MNAKMTARERMVWEQAVRVLRQNSVTATVSVEPPGAQAQAGRAPRCRLIEASGEAGLIRGPSC